MPRPLRLLLLEDDEIDAEVELAAIRAGGIECEAHRVNERATFIAALDEGGWDLVLADYSLPAFTGIEALRLVRARDPLLPFILVSGTLGEERAIESLKAGANDYLIKDNLVRLAPAIRRAREEHQARLRHLATQRALEESEERYRGIVEDQTELVARFTPQGALAFANQAFGRCFGRPVSSLPGAPFLSFVAPADRDLVEQALAGLSPEKPTTECECRALGDAEVPSAALWLTWTFRGLFDCSTRRARRCRCRRSAATSPNASP
jgi:CheY-like chemotaxis protein